MNSGTWIWIATSNLKLMTRGLSLLPQIQMYSVHSVGAVHLICSFSLLCININAPSPETYLFIFTWTLLWAKAIAYKNHFTVVEDNIRWEIFFENWNKSWDILMDICVWIMQISILKQYLQMRRRSVFNIFGFGVKFNLVD